MVALIRIMVAHIGNVTMLIIILWEEPSCNCATCLCGMWGRQSVFFGPAWAAQGTAQVDRHGSLFCEAAIAA